MPASLSSYLSSHQTLSGSRPPIMASLTIPKRFIRCTNFSHFNLKYFSTNGTLKRFKVFPTDLFRIMTSDRIRLREKQAQLNKNSHSFDFTLKNGLVVPAEGDTFSGNSIICNLNQSLNSLNLLFIRSQWIITSTNWFAYVGCCC